MHTVFIRLCALLLCFGLSSRAALAAPDIADFSLGMTRDDILLRATSPCGDRLCGQVGFGGRVWEGSFRFHGNELDAISLFGPPEDDYIEAAFSAFAGSPYVVYRAVGDDAVFDFPSLAAEGLRPEALDDAFGEFLHALGSAGGSFVSLFYTEPAVYAALKQEAQAARQGPGARTGAIPGKTAGPAAPHPTNSAPDAGLPDAGGKPQASPPSERTPGAASGEPAAPAEKADAKKNGDAEPEPRSDGVVCVMTIAGDGIAILIMTRASLDAEMEAGAARLTSCAAPGRRDARSTRAMAASPGQSAQKARETAFFALQSVPPRIRD